MKANLSTIPKCEDCQYLDNNFRRDLELPSIEDRNNGCTRNLKGLKEDCPRQKWKKDFEVELIAKVKRTKDTISMGEKLLTADILGMDYPSFFKEVLGDG